MKKIRLITMLSAFTLAAAGTFGLANLKEVKKIDAVEAATPSSYSHIYRFTAPAEYWGDTVYVHYFNNDNDKLCDWPGVNISNQYSYNESSRKVYTFCTNATYSKIIFHNNSGWQTDDITIGANTAWYLDNGNTPGTWTPSNQTYYFYDYKNIFQGNAKCYAWQSNGDLNNGTYPGVSMTKVQYGSGQLYTISLDPAFDEVKIGVGDSANTGDQWVNQHHGGILCWWDTGNSEWSSDLAWVKAHDWANNTMHIRDIATSNNSDTGACRGNDGYYKKAKDAYQSFGTDVKNKFANVNEYNDAKTRFSAWALANGETASWSGTTLTISSARTSLLPTANTENTNTIAIIVIISLVSVTAIGGFFFIKKRKEN